MIIVIAIAAGLVVAIALGCAFAFDEPTIDDGYEHDPRTIS